MDMIAWRLAHVHPRGKSSHPVSHYKRRPRMFQTHRRRGGKDHSVKQRRKYTDVLDEKKVVNRADVGYDEPHPSKSQPPKRRDFPVLLLAIASLALRQAAPKRMSPARARGSSVASQINIDGTACPRACVEMSIRRSFGGTSLAARTTGRLYRWAMPGGLRSSARRARPQRYRRRRQDRLRYAGSWRVLTLRADY